MELLEFITYCQLKGLVKQHTKLEQEHDIHAKHYRIQIDNKRYVASFIYAVLDTAPDQAVLVRSESSCLTNNTTVYDGQPTVKDIIEGIMHDA